MKKTKIIALLLVVIMTMAAFASCAKLETAMEYKGEKITFNMYSYWMSQIKSGYVNQANDTDEYWSTKYSNGETFEQKMREIVDFNVKTNLVCLKLFKDMGLKVPEDKMQELETSLKDMLSVYPTKSALNEFLSNYNINYDMMHDIYEAELKVETVYNELYKTGGDREITTEKLDSYFKENYVLADAIILYTKTVYEVDEKGEIVYDETKGTPKTRELTEDEIKAKKALADELVDRLEKGESFEELKKTYNEDPNKDKFTEGYYISANDLNEYGTSIVLSAQTLEVGEFEKVEEEASICILKRKELVDKAYTSKEYADQFSNLRYYAEQNDFKLYMNELIKDVVVYKDVTDKISVRDAKLIG